MGGCENAQDRRRRVSHRPRVRGLSRGRQRAAFLPIRDVTSFTQQALTAGTIAVRVTDSEGDTIADSFKVEGLADALKALPCAPRFGH